MRQRGVALILAVVMVALATVMATRIASHTALDVRRTTGLAALDQAWEVALGAEAWAAQILLEDSQQGGKDHPGEAWAMPLPPLPIDGGEVEGRLEDMQGRFNINNLVTAEGKVNEAGVAQFESLLDALGLERRWARIAADWLDADTIAGVPEGAEDGVYLSQQPPYRAANGPVTSTSELMALPGFTLENFRKLRPFVAALPVGTRINVCSAPPQLLAALAEGGSVFGNAESLERNRRDGCFPTLDDLRASLGDAEYQKVQATVSDNSSWFRAVTTVRIGTSELTLYSLLERNSAGLTRPSQRSVGTE
ncbi:MAG: type II secretion system minor pseudopilin GspK [Gammaproteobacteria bacterium]|nr:type II secretion system minor pseudopilin GspK [Gammaproteobacteria bacterium]